MHDRIRVPAGLLQVARAILAVEPLLLALLVFGVWQQTPRWLWPWLLVLLPVVAARWALYRRLWTRTPLDVWLIAFLALGLFNVAFAPFRRLDSLWSALEVLARVFVGIVLYLSFVERARMRGKLDHLLLATLHLTLLVGILALTASQWNSKAAPLQAVTSVLPRLTGFPGAEAGFNANEIGGALAWLTPLMAGLAIHAWRNRQRRLAVTELFVLLFLAVFFGQSRLAIIGLVLALAALIGLLVPRGRWQVVASLALIAFVVVELWVVVSAAVPSREERTVSNRLLMWQAALNVVLKYPLTGVGMATFRSREVRAEFPVVGYEERVLPHAHNEWIHMAADMGLPGFIVFTAWHIVAGWMLLQSWRRGDSYARAVAVATGAGLLAHAVYAMGDAIALWDRFAFVFWWLLGLAGANYTLVKLGAAREAEQSSGQS